MRLKAYFTLENSVIIPFFTIIMVALVLFTFYMHDQIIVKNSLFQASILIEDEEVITDEEKNNEYVIKVNQYIQSKTFITSNVNVQAKSEGSKYILEGDGTCSSIPFLSTTETIDRSISTDQPRYVALIRIARLTLKAKNDLDFG